MNNSRSVITGASIVCSLGCHLDRIVENLLSEESRFSNIPFSSEFFKNRRVAMVDDGSLDGLITDNRSLRYMSRETRLAVSACLLCLKDAAIGHAYEKERIALFAGTGSSGIQLETIEKLLTHSVSSETGLFDLISFGKIALYKLNPLLSFQILPNMPAAMCAIMADIRGKNLVFNPWEGNALLALYEAWFEIRSGRSKIVLCGGSDCKTHSNAFITFSEYGLLKDSDVVMSEGSAYLAIENEQSTINRNQGTYCAIRHMYHQSRPGSVATDGVCTEIFYSEMIRTTLTESNLAPQDIDLVISSNDYTAQTDAMENQTILQVFSCPMISPKKILGNTYAAAGMINLAIAAQIIKAGRQVSGRQIKRIFITSFAPGSEKFCIILEQT